jgi:hypothetical protein
MYANGFYARGIVQINGITYNPTLGNNTALDVNNSGSAPYGGIFKAGSSAGTGIYAYASAGSSTAISAVSYSSGATALYAGNSTGAYALLVDGLMSITNSYVVNNLNANYVNGLNFASYPVAGSTTGVLDLTNKPGVTGAYNSWLAVVIFGTTYYIPVWQ